MTGRPEDKIILRTPLQEVLGVMETLLRVLYLSSFWQVILAGSEQVHLVTFFDCSAEDNLTSLAEVEDCDIFAYMGAQVASDVISTDLNLDLRLHQVKIDSEIGSEIFLEAIAGYADVIREIYPDIVRAFIGPQSLRAVDYILPIIARFNNLTSVSHAVTSVSADRYRKFYRSLPTDLVINGGRLALLPQFGWLRIGTLSSANEGYAEAAGLFGELFVKFFENLDENFRTRLSLSLQFEDNNALENRLQLLALNDIRVIQGFFGPKDARNVLCKAKAYNLTTELHSWILPAYVNPYWWKSSSKRGSDVSCTDEEMRDILESVIFVGGVKFPPIGTTMSYFVSKLSEKVTEFFPNFELADLLPFLLNSRAVNAYDAVMLVANSVDFTLERSTPLDTCLIDCEWCRIYTPSFSSDHLVEACNKYCPKDYDVTTICYHREKANLFTPEETQRRLFYGQVMYTQFVDGHHCPIGMWWNTENGTKAAMNNFLRLSDLADCQCGNSDMLRDIAGFLQSYSDLYNCPSDFTWRENATGAPDTISVEHSSIHTALLVVVGVATFIGILIAIFFCCVNIVFSNDQSVRASSPRLNVIVLTGYVLLQPTALFSGLVLSANELLNPSPTLLTTFCQFSLWLSGIGFSLIFATILMKTWRLYWIFSRNIARLSQTRALSDSHLIVGIAIFSSVTVIILTIWSSREEWRYQYQDVILPLSRSSNQDLVSFRNLNLTFCSASTDRASIAFSSIQFGYCLLFVFMSLFFIVCNKKMSSNFRHDSLLSFRALILSLFPLVFQYVAVWIIQFEPSLYMLFWWIDVIALVVVNILSQIAMFSQITYKVYVHKRDECRLKFQEEQDQTLKYQYDIAVAEEKLLRQQLEEKERTIEALRKAKQ